jgi:hypothetical protein
MAEIATAALVGVAGILGTLTGVTLTERMRREGTRREHLLTHSLLVYSELLTELARLVDNVRAWSWGPVQDRKEADDEALNRLTGRLRVVASPEVLALFQEVNSRVQEFHRLRELEVLPHHQRIQREGTADDDLARRQRLALSDKAEAIAECYGRIEAVVRAEMSPGRGSPW